MNFKYVSKVLASYSGRSRHNEKKHYTIKVALNDNTLFALGYLNDDKLINFNETLKLTGENPANEAFDMICTMRLDIENAISDLEGK